MRLKAKLLSIEAGGPLIVVLNPKIAKELDLAPADRVRILAEKKYIVAIADKSSTGTAVKIASGSGVGEVIAVYDAPVKIVEIGGSKPTSVQGDKRTKIRRDDGNHF
jgi:anaerobic selenocysteine-containing dehydrogenase